MDDLLSKYKLVKLTKKQNKNFDKAIIIEEIKPEIRYLDE